MKKTITGLALLAATVTASAANSVTVYGVADANVEYSNHNFSAGRDGGSKFALSSGGLSSSRWGLRGVEDLGGGQRAIFALESGFSLDNGVATQGGRLFGRQAWVGIGSGQHQLTFGRQYTSLFLTMANYSPTAYATSYEPVPTIAGLFLREDNVIKYHGDFGPLSAEMHWSFGEQPGTFQGAAGFGGGLDYRAGPFGVAVAYDDVNSAKTAGEYSRAQKAAVGLRYQIGKNWLAQAAYRYGKNDAPLAGTVGRDDLWWLGIHYQATSALDIITAVYYDNIRVLRTGGGTTNPSNPWQVSLIADYALSKRTDLYLTAAYTKNSALNFDSYNGVAAVYQLAPNASSQLGGAVGMRHRF
ncbi:porin [Cupriavidus sp. CuC1]|uniref:porin n=1 Tax=Cupriavidus sp. CuC1 TaxID=3373131 RepID=UPI0037CF8DBA